MVSAAVWLVSANSSLATSAESAPQAATRLTSIRGTAQRLQDNCCGQFEIDLQLPSVYRRRLSTGKSEEKLALHIHCG